MVSNFKSENTVLTLMVCISTWVMVFCSTVLAADWNVLPDTGQTQCFNIAGDVIVCPEAGQALYGQDAQYNSPEPSYTTQSLDSDDTVADNNSGLVWQQDTADINGDDARTTDDKIDWQTAIDYCDSLSYFGEDDWRLPGKFELQSIVDYGRSNSAINPAFQCKPNGYWSVTTSVSNTDNAWYIYFNSGSGAWSNKTNSTRYIRCVRTGK